MIPGKDLKKYEEFRHLLKKQGFSLVEKTENLYNRRYIWKNFDTFELVILELDMDYDGYFKKGDIVDERTLYDPGGDPE